MTEIRIPPPPKALAPHANGNSHFPKSKATKEHREIAKLCSLGLKKMPGAVRVEIVWNMAPDRNAYHPLDIQNAIASLKAAMDGVVDAGVIGADNHRTVIGFCPVTLNREKKLHKGRSEVILRLHQAMEVAPE
jgi:hypothetical protein